MVFFLTTVKLIFRNALTEKDPLTFVYTGKKLRNHSQEIASE